VCSCRQSKALSSDDAHKTNGFERLLPLGHISCPSMPPCVGWWLGKTMTETFRRDAIVSLSRSFFPFRFFFSIFFFSLFFFYEEGFRLGLWLGLSQVMVRLNEIYYPFRLWFGEMLYVCVNQE
jgi:hypothetical protein